MSFKEEIRHDYPLTKDSIVFDVGGYKGEWSDIIFKKYGCKIFCFEPVFDIESKDIDVYNIAVGGTSRVESWQVDKDSTGGYCSQGETKAVFVTDIMEVIKAHNIEHIDLLKINIEGMEYELLDRLIKADWISNITDIQVQFHRISESDRMMWEIQRDLKKTHETTYQFRYVWENWRLKNSFCPKCKGHVAVNSMGHYCTNHCGYEIII
jgi:FkbM family methyltransferase